MKVCTERVFAGSDRPGTSGAQILHSSCDYELKISQNSSMVNDEEWGIHGAPFLAEELLVTDDSKEKESQFFLEMQLQREEPCYSR